jgi:hypothetical protein
MMGAVSERFSRAAYDTRGFRRGPGRGLGRERDLNHRQEQQTPN